jgi:hypothetical protein
MIRLLVGHNSRFTSVTSRAKTKSHAKVALAMHDRQMRRKSAQVSAKRSMHR